MRALTKNSSRVIITLGMSLVVLSLIMHGLGSVSDVRAAPLRVGPACTTDVTGDIFSDEIWTPAGSPYCVVTSTVSIQTGVVLTIQPGVWVEFNTGSRLQTQGGGRLYAVGTPTDPITFTSASASPGRGSWVGLSFANNALTNVVRYAVIEYAQNGVDFGDVVAGNSVTSNTFRFIGTGTGTGAAVQGVPDGADLSFNTIYSVENGIRLNKAFNNTVLANTVYDVDDHGIAFVRNGAAGGDGNTISNNIVYRCGGDGLRMEGGDDTTIRANLIYDCVGAGVWLEGGDNNTVGGSSFSEGNTIYRVAYTTTTASPGAIVLEGGRAPQVQYNNVYGNGVGGGAYRAALYISGTQAVGGGYNVMVADNVIRDDAGDGMYYSDTNTGSPSIYGNSVCGDCVSGGGNYGLRNLNGSITAAGNWWGTNAPVLGTHLSGPIAFSPWISLTVTPSVTTLPADGTSTSTISVLMNDGQGNTVPPGTRVITLEASAGTIPITVTLDNNGTASVIYTAGTSAGTVVITATEVCGVPVTTTLLLQSTNIAIWKGGNPATVLPGEQITYTVRYTVTGGTASQVWITDTLPGNATFVADTSPFTRTTGGGTVGWFLNDVSDAGDGSFQVVLSPTTTCGAVITNAVAITTTTLDTNSGDNTSSAPGSVINCADVAIAKQANTAAVPVSGTITYTIYFSNTTSTIPASNIRMTDTLPVNTTWLWDSADSLGLTPVVTCTAGPCARAWITDSLAPLTTFSFQLSVRVDECPVGLFKNITNTVEIETTTPEGDLSNNVSRSVVSVQCELPNLAVVKNDNVGPMTASFGQFMAQYLPEEVGGVGVMAQQEYVGPGGYITYSIAYVNTDDTPASGVVLSKTLDANATYVGGGWARVGNTQYYTYYVGDLPAHYGDLVQFVVRVNDGFTGTWVFNRVCIFGDQPDWYPDDNCSYEQTPISAGVDLEVTKAASHPCVSPGDLLAYNIHYRNAGNRVASGVVLIEYLPDNTIFLSAPGWTGGGGVYTYSLGSVGVGVSGTVPFGVQVDPALSVTLVSAITNVVRIDDDGSQGEDLDTTDNAFTLITPVDTGPDLVVVKNDNVGPVLAAQRERMEQVYTALYGPQGLDRLRQVGAQAEYVGPGDLITYTIAYVNTGVGTATNVVLTETLDPYVSYVGFGWTQVGSSQTYFRNVGTLAPGQGGEWQMWVRVNDPFTPVWPHPTDKVLNTVQIAASEAECNTSNNSSSDDTPVEGAQGPYTAYLPVILKSYPPLPTPTPTSTGEPTPTATPYPGGNLSDVDVNPETNVVYVASPNGNSVFAINGYTPTISTTIGVGQHPMGLAVYTYTNKVYVANPNSWSVSVIQNDSLLVLSIPNVGAGPVKVAANPVTERIYVSNYWEKKTAVIDPDTDSVLYLVEKMEAAQGAYGIDVDPALNRIYVATRDAGELVVIEGALAEADPWNYIPIFVKPPVACSLWSVAANPNTGHVFVPCPERDEVFVLDGATLSPSSARLELRPTGWVRVIDAKDADWVTLGLAGAVRPGEEGIDVNLASDRVFVSDADGDAVFVLQDDAVLSNITVVRRVVVGDYPQGVGANPVTNLVYVANSGDRTLSVIDSSLDVIATIPLP